jgi:prevent-host-death family protein
MQIRQMLAAEFKQKCLALMDDVALNHTELIITKHGVPVCRLVPLPKTAKRLGWMKNTVTILGDLTEPVISI